MIAMKLNVLLFYFVFCVKGDVTTRPKEYIVNLDVPAIERWSHIVPEYKQSLLIVDKLIKSQLPAITIPLLEKLAAEVENVLPQPFADEMKGIAKTLNMNLGDIVGANILYDVTAFCTSIVTQDKNGVILHGRNLDYHFTDVLRNLTIDVNFQRNATTVYKGTTYAGYVGLMTGMKPKAFTISVDERDQGLLIENILIFLLDRKVPPVSFLVRQTLENEHTFQSAVKRLSDTVTMASAYFIVGGIKPEEGVIITRDRLGAADCYYINTDDKRWFVVETNYDHWVTPPPTDDRRDPAIKMMNSIGQQGISNNTLFMVLSSPPVLRAITTYTVFMSAADPHAYRAWVRHVNKDQLP